MKYFLTGFAFFILGVVPVSANELTITEVALPYDIVGIDSDPRTGHTYLGELENFPIMYEMTVVEPITFTTEIRQLYNRSTETTNFSLIVIRQNDDGGGVTEVARMKPTSDDWAVVKDATYGMKFWESETFSVAVEPGVYRIEISTPENLGRYVLTFGEGGEQSGYLDTLSNVRTTQKFFGYSIIKLLSSSYIYYPIGIFLLLFAIHRTWKYRQAITHVD